MSNRIVTVKRQCGGCNLVFTFRKRERKLKPNLGQFFCLGCRSVERADVPPRSPKVWPNSLSPEYITWVGMKSRCLNPKHDAFPNYGGRGITICRRWIASFRNFFEDMGPRLEGLTLERLDNNGNYEPGNCIWATREVQNKNKTNTRNILINGQVKSLADWCKEFKLSYQTAHGRMRRGWSASEALTTPPISKNAKRSSRAREAA